MQLFGLGLAGLAYSFIVEPPQMVENRALPIPTLLIVQKIGTLWISR